MTAFAMPESDASEVRPRRTGACWPQSPAMGLDKAQRRAASRALLPGGAVAPEHRLTTVQVARHLGAYGWALWIFLTVGLANGALFLGAESPTDRLWAAAALIGFGLAAVHGCALRKARAIVVDEFGG